MSFSMVGKLVNSTRKQLSLILQSKINDNNKSTFESMFPLMGKMLDTDWESLQMCISGIGEKKYIKSLKMFYRGRYGVEPIELEVV